MSVISRLSDMFRNNAAGVAMASAAATMPVVADAAVDPVESDKSSYSVDGSVSIGTKNDDILIVGANEIIEENVESNLVEADVTLKLYDYKTVVLFEAAQGEVSKLYANQFGGEGFTGFIVDEDVTVSDYSLELATQVNNRVGILASAETSHKFSFDYSMANISEYNGVKPMQEDIDLETAVDVNAYSFGVAAGGAIFFASKIDGTALDTNATEVDDTRTLGGFVVDTRKKGGNGFVGGATYGEFEIGDNTAEIEQTTVFAHYKGKPSTYSEAAIGVQQTWTENTISPDTSAITRDTETTSAYLRGSYNLGSRNVPVEASVYGQWRKSSEDLKDGNGEGYTNLDRDQYGIGAAIDMGYTLKDAFGSNSGDLEFKAGVAYTHMKASERGDYANATVDAGSNELNWGSDATRLSANGTSAHASIVYNF